LLQGPLRTRLTTVVAVLSLGVGIGVNSAVFGVADGLVLRPLPFPNADRIAIIWQRSPGLQVPQDWLSLGQYADIANGNTVFEHVAAAIGSSYNVTGDGAAERVDGMRVSSSFFQIFGATTEMGRVFQATEDEPGQPPAVILSYGFWQRRFGGDRRILGHTLTLNGNSVTIVGVMPRSATLNHDVMPAVNAIRQADLLLPLPIPASARNNRGGEDFDLFVTLKPGVALATAQAQMDGLAARMKQQYPGVYPPQGGLTLSIVPLLDQVVGDVRLTLRLLVGAAVLVLLIACANVTNLSLSRAASRERELAIRAALGANRRELIRLLMAESVALSLIGGGLGLLMGWLGIVALKTFGSANIPRLAELGLDGRMFLFTFVIATLGGLAVGVVPALHASRADPNAAFRGNTSLGGRGVTSGHRRVRRILAGGEIALSVALLIGAVLLVRSYRRISFADPGFDPRNVLSLRLTLPGTHYNTPEAVRTFYRNLEDRVAALPGVTHVGTNYQLPLSSVALAWEPIGIDGYVPPVPGGDLVISSTAYISADYPRTMGIPLVAGRFFNELDNDSGPPVVMVDQHLATRFWPHESALGKRLRQGANGPWRTVVGVVGNTEQYAVQAQPPITAFFPATQFRLGSRFLVVRAADSVDVATLLPDVSRVIKDLDADLPVYDVSTMEQRLHDALARRRLAMTLLGVFALLAVVLAMVGVYGVVGYWVEQRTREIGIRVALGASRRAVYQLISREAGTIIGAGLIAGAGGAAALTWLLKGMLFGVTPTDPSTFALALAILGVVGVLAAWVPARRAVRVSPMTALKEE
jgi:predicted permease